MLTGSEPFPVNWARFGQLPLTRIEMMLINFSKVVEQFFNKRR
jgi:hypothetical protein